MTVVEIINNFKSGHYERIWDKSIADVIHIYYCVDRYVSEEFAGPVTDN